MDVLESIGKGLTKVFKTSSERYVKKHLDFVADINSLEPELASLSDEQLRENPTPDPCDLYIM